MRSSVAILVAFETSNMSGYDAWDEQYDFSRPLPHSGLGIASCVIGGLAVLMGIGLVIALALDSGDLDAEDEFTLQAAEVFLYFLANTAAALVGLVLGIIGAATAKRNKLFAGLGIGVNALVLIGLMAIVIIGVMMEQAGRH